MTPFVLIFTLAIYTVGMRPADKLVWDQRITVVHFETNQACAAALDSLAAIHGDRITGACYATGARP